MNDFKYTFSIGIDHFSNFRTHLVIIACLTLIGLHARAQLFDGGTRHSITICPDSTVWCAGDNSEGQLGDGTTNNSTVAVQAIGLTEMIAVSAEYYHSLGLKADGTVWGWGKNSFGQLGDGTTTDRPTPVQMTPITDVIAIVGGGEHNIMLKSDSTVWTCGQNWQGQIGDGTTTDRHNPVQVPGLTGVIAIAGGTAHTVALKADGTVWVWGYNAFGQVGNGTFTDVHSPLQVSGLINIVAITSGYGHNVAIRNDGTVWTWGRNDNGQLGDGTTTDRPTPVQVSGISNASQATAGHAHTIVLLQDSTLLAWGRNSSGQLGDGTISAKHTPVSVPGLTCVTHIGSGRYISAALINNCQYYRWGNNGFGQLGTGGPSGNPNPLKTDCLGNITTTTCCNAVASFSTALDTICEGDSITFSNSSTGSNAFEWQENSSPFATDMNPTRIFNVNGTYKITLKAIAACCFDTMSAHITVLPLPVVSFTGLDNEICENDSTVMLTGNPTGGTFIGNGLNGSQFDPAVAAAGTHDITYTYTDNNGCTNADTQSVTVYTPPVVSFSGLNPSYCLIDTLINLSGSPLGGSFTGPGISGSQFNPITAGIGDHSITYRYTDIHDCTNSFSQQVTVDSLLTLDLGSDTTICNGCSLVLDAGYPGSSYLWSNGDTTQMTTVAAAGDYWVTVTDNSGCFGSDTIAVSVGASGVGSANNYATSMKVYPNPFTDQAVLYLSNPRRLTHTFAMYDVMGKPVKHLENVTADKIIIDRETLANGLYFYRVTNEEGFVGVGKLMVN